MYLVMIAKPPLSHSGTRADGPARGTARLALLEAAAQMAREEGLTALAVDRLAARAGVSKGAFFHHFPTRRDMVLALIEHLAQSFENDLQASLAAGTTFAEALVETTFAQVERDPAFLVTLVTAVILDRGIGADVEARTADFHQRMLADGTPAATAVLVRATLDGLLQHLIVRAGQPADPEFMRLLRESLRLALAGSGQG